MAAAPATALPLSPALPQRPGLLRLRSDEALVELFRAGRDDAFDEIVERYRDKLLAHARHVLRGSDEAQDVVQDVFMRAHRALRRDDREMNLKPWLYRIAHNRCMDVIRRPTPVPSEPALDEAAPADTVSEVQRRDDLRLLVEDIGQLPDQQRSALVIRELGGLSYEDMAAALDTTVPAIKSLLVRARIGLAEAAEARAASCAEVLEELRGADRPSALARRHAALCEDCRAAQQALRAPRRMRAAAAFLPAFAPGPFHTFLRWIGMTPDSPHALAGDAAGGAAAKAIATAASVAALGGAVAAAPVPSVDHHAPARAKQVAVASARHVAGSQPARPLHDPPRTAPKPAAPSAPAPVAAPPATAPAPAPTVAAPAPRQAPSPVPPAVTDAVPAPEADPVAPGEDVTAAAAAADTTSTTATVDPAAEPEPAPAG